MTANVTANGLVGVDPYDALMGTRIPSWVRSNSRARQAAIQLRKRLPIDLSRLLGVRPYLMAKSVGCALSAVAREAWATSDGSQRAVLHSTALELARSLETCGGTLGGGAYGYEFDVQTRWAYYPAKSPNIIATSFVGRGLLEAGIAFDQAEWLGAAASSAEFIEENLLLQGAGDSYFRYTTTSTTLVHNANLLGAMLCASVAAIVPGMTVDGGVLMAAARSIDGQNDDGSWAYGVGPGLSWCDSFHTAYNLDALLHLWLATGDARARSALDAGVAYWTGSFFGPAGEPYYTPAARWPIDVHAGATAVDLLARLVAHRFETANLATRVADWMRANLVADDGITTRYQKRRLFTDKRHFARWGDAHWIMAVGSLSCLDSGMTAPLEARLAEVGRR